MTRLLYGGRCYIIPGFANTGTITVSNATLALGGIFSAGLLTKLGAITLSAGQVEILGTADNTGGMLAIGTGSQIGNTLGPITLAGTLLNGTVTDAGRGLNLAPGTGVLDGVSYLGTLNLSAGGAGVTLTDNTSVAGAAGTAGSIIDTGAGAALLLRGTETLDNATILLGNAGLAAGIGTSDAWLASSSTTATLGAHLSVQQIGTNAVIAANGWSPFPGFGPSDTLISQGTITGAVAGGRLAISGYGTFINQGSISVGGGDTLAVTVGQFGNTGTITAGLGGTVLLGQPAGAFGTPVWSNAGQIVVAGGTLVLAGSVTTGQLGTITETAGSVVLAGILSNAGATLTLGTHGTALSLPALSLSGTILGGSISDSAGVLSVGTTGSALLDGVAYAGTLALTHAGAFLRVRDGLALSGAANVTGAGSLLDFVGTETIDHAQILLGAAGSAAMLDVAHDNAVTGASTLTFGSNLSIVQAGALATIGRADGMAGDAIVNAGTITAAVLGGTLTLGGAGFLNQGRINVSNGDTLAIGSAANGLGGFSNTGSIVVSGAVLSLGGSLTLAQLGQVSLSNGLLAVAGTLDIGGGTLAIGLGTKLGRVALTGTLRNGTVTDAGGGLAAGSGATLDGITYQGVLDLSRPFAQLTVADGLTMAAQAGGRPGAIVLTGAQTRLIAATSETFDNAAISLGSVAQYYAGQKLAAPELAGTAGTQLTLGAHNTVTLAGTAGTLGDAALGQWSDSIVNAGQIVAATAIGTLSLASSFFTNTGTITAASGGIVLTDDAGFVNAGTIQIGAGSALQVLLYNWYAAPNPALSVFTNSGTIAMGGGILQELTANGLFPAMPLANLAAPRSTVMV